METAALICDYIYSAFQKLKELIDNIEDIALGLLKAVQKFARTLNTKIKNKLKILVDKIKDKLDEIQKDIKPLVFNGAKQIPLICDPLWKCLALLKELLNSSSQFYKSLQKSAEEMCWDDEKEKENFFDNILNLINDYEEFSKFICNMGFGFDFCIDAIKLSLSEFTLKSYDWKKWVLKMKAKIEEKLNSFLSYILNSPLFELLKSLTDFFKCVIGDIQGCAEIQTAKNFFYNVLATLHIKEEGDGFVIDPDFTKMLFKVADQMLDDCQKVIDTCTKLNIVLINPIELKVAAKAYEGSKNIWPGQLTMDDITGGIMNAYDFLASGRWKKYLLPKVYSTEKQAVIHAFFIKRSSTKNGCPETEAGSLSSGAIAQTLRSQEMKNAPGSEKNPDYDLDGTIGGVAKGTVNTAKNAIVDKAVPVLNDMRGLIFKSPVTLGGAGSVESELKKLNTMFNTTRYTTEYIVKNMRIESDGMVYVSDGCCDIALTNLPPNPKGIEVIEAMYEIGSDIEDDSCIYDLNSGEIISGTEAAIICATQPDNPLAVRCKQIWATINNMYDEQNIVQKL